MTEKLKIGVLLNSYQIPSWQFQILNELHGSEYVKIVFALKNNIEALPQDKHGSFFRHTLLKSLEKADSIIFKTGKDFNRMKDLSGIFEDVPEITAKSAIAIENGSFNENMIAEIKKYQPDIILKFSSILLSDGIPDIPKYGIWENSIDNNKDEDGLLAGFREVVTSSKAIESRLGILNRDDQRRLAIFSSRESTCPYSIHLTRNKLFWRTALFMPRVIKGIYTHGEKYFDSLISRFNNPETNDENPAKAKPFLPAGKSLLNYLRVAAWYVRKKLVYSDAFSWQLLFHIKNGENSFPGDFGNFKKLLPPKDRFWADPFVVEKDGEYFIFVEEFIYSKNKAHIAVLKLDKSGSLLSNETIIEKPYHMSYPFVFKMGDSYYMIPETSKNRTIDLYKCVVFPNKWEFCMTLMENISAADTTLFYHNQSYWLFTAVDQTDNISGCSTELFLFFNKDIFSANWKSHPCNPVVSDVTKARPAGKLFIREGKIYRPSQNCSGLYGNSFNLNQITRLDENAYSEVTAQVIEPSWDKSLKGTHTYNSDNDFVIIDSFTFRKRLSIN